MRYLEIPEWNQVVRYVSELLKTRPFVSCFKVSTLISNFFKSSYEMSLYPSFGEQTGQKAENSCPYKVSYPPSSNLHM